MTRPPRITPPGTIQHVTSRFVNRAFLLASQRERDEYLARVAGAIEGVGWVILAYALMSSHVHWCFVAHVRPVSDFLQPLHTGFALWLNTITGRSGPVFERPHNVTIGPSGTPGVLAYVHNNTVRGGVVARAQDSTWTSHRAFLGLDPAPRWLDVERALDLAGFDASPAGRRAFGEYVDARRLDPRDPAFSGDYRNATRATARQLAGAPVEVQVIVEERERRFVDVVSREDTPLRPRWHGSPAEVIVRVADALRISTTELRGPGRSQQLHRARQVALLVWTRYLGRPMVEMACALGRSTGSASLALGRRPDVASALAPIARVIAAECWPIEPGSGLTIVR